MSRATLLLLALAVGCGAPPPAPPAPSPPRATLICGGDEVDLADLMEHIGRQAGRTILVDPTIQETVSADLPCGLTWREAVDVVARATSCEVEERPGGILVLVRPPVVSFEGEGLDAREVVQKLVALGHAMVLCHPTFQGRLDVLLQRVHWLRAVHHVVKQVGRFEVVQESEDLLRIVPALTPEPDVRLGTVAGHDDEELGVVMDATGRLARWRLPPASATGREAARRARLLAALADLRPRDRVLVRWGLRGDEPVLLEVLPP